MPNRPNLLITTIGRLEYYQSWIEENRNYDIALIYYPNKIDSDVEAELRSKSDFFFKNSGFKYPNIKSIFSANPHLLQYNYYWMPDHDVMMRNGPVSAMFDIYIMKD